MKPRPTLDDLIAMDPDEPFTGRAPGEIAAEALIRLRKASQNGRGLRLTALECRAIRWAEDRKTNFPADWYARDPLPRDNT